MLCDDLCVCIYSCLYISQSCFVCLCLCVWLWSVGFQQHQKQPHQHHFFSKTYSADANHAHAGDSLVRVVGAEGKTNVRGNHLTYPYASFRKKDLVRFMSFQHIGYLPAVFNKSTHANICKSNMWQLIRDSFIYYCLVSSFNSFLQMLNFYHLIINYFLRKQKMYITMLMININYYIHIYIMLYLIFNIIL